MRLSARTPNIYFTAIAFVASFMAYYILTWGGVIQLDLAAMRQVTAWCGIPVRYSGANIILLNGME
jgi:hypothetical protein